MKLEKKDLVLIATLFVMYFSIFYIGVTLVRPW